MVIEWMRMRWAEHVVRIGEMKNAYIVLVGKPEGRDHSENLRIDGRVVFEWILGK
jgi:hypothetical protein